MESPAPATLTWSGVTARRTARHALTKPTADLGPAGAGGVLCGAHAQVLSATVMQATATLTVGTVTVGAHA